MRPSGINTVRESKDVSMFISEISSVSNVSNVESDSSSQSIVFDSADVKRLKVQDTNNQNSSLALK